MQRGSGERDEGSDEIGVALRCAADGEARDGRVQPGGDEPFEEPLGVQFASESECSERGEWPRFRHAELLLPGEAGYGELGEAGKGADEVDEVRKVGELAEGKGGFGEGGMVERTELRDALEVNVCEGEGAEVREVGENAGKGILDGGRGLGRTEHSRGRHKPGDGQLADVAPEVWGRLEEPLEGGREVMVLQHDRAEQVKARGRGPRTTHPGAHSERSSVFVEEVDDVVRELERYVRHDECYRGSTAVS